MIRRHLLHAVIGSYVILFGLSLAGCRGISTYDSRENEREVLVDKTQARHWEDRRFSIDSLALHENELSGVATVEMSTVLETVTKTRKDYDLVTHEKRELLLIEDLGGCFRSLPQTYHRDGPVFAVIELPFRLVGEVVRQTVGPVFEILSMKGLSGQYEERVLARRTCNGEVETSEPAFTDRKVTKAPAATIPLFINSSDFRLGKSQTSACEIQTDSEGQFSLPAFPLDGFMTPDEAKAKAFEKVAPIFVTKDLAGAFIKTAEFSRPATAEIKVRTNVVSTCDTQHEKRQTHEGTNIFTTNGCQFLPEVLDKSLRDYLSGITNAAVSHAMQTVTIVLKDSATHTPLIGAANADVEAHFVTGVSRESVRHDMQQELLKYVRPTHVGRFLPKTHELPEMVRMPDHFNVGRDRTFKIHVPASYRLKATHPKYMFIEGEVAFSAAKDTTVIYMEEKGAKHRVSIEEGESKGRIE